MAQSGLLHFTFGLQADAEISQRAIIFNSVSESH